MQFSIRREQARLKQVDLFRLAQTSCILYWRKGAGKQAASCSLLGKRAARADIGEGL